MVERVWWVTKMPKTADIGVKTVVFQDVETNPDIPDPYSSTLSTH